jgi:hypothetical protein
MNGFSHCLYDFLGFISWHCQYLTLYTVNGNVPFFNFYGVVWGETESTWYVSHSLTYCTISGWYMVMEYLVRWELTGETEVFGENLPQCHHLSVYGSTGLVDLGRFFSFLIHTHLVGLFGRGIGPSQGRYLHTEQHKHRINAHRHTCLEWDSNPRSQCSSGRRQFIP